MNTKYLHLRNHETVERDGEQVVAIAAWGGATIGYVETEHDDGIVVYYAIAKCSPQDNFCKRIGRNITRGRLEKLDLQEADYFQVPAGLPKGEVQSLLIEKYYEAQEPFFSEVRNYVY